MAPNVDINIQSERFWARSTASSILRSLDFRSCWMVFIHVIRGRPTGLVQFPVGEAVKICFASVSSGIHVMCPNWAGALTGLWLRDWVAWLTFWLLTYDKLQCALQCNVHISKTYTFGTHFRSTKTPGEWWQSTTWSSVQSRLQHSAQFQHTVQRHVSHFFFCESLTSTTQ